MIGDFKIIQPRELPLLAKICLKENNGNMEQTLDDLELIDKLLLFEKSRSLMMRKYNHKRMIDKIIAQHCGIYQNEQWNKTDYTTR